MLSNANLYRYNSVFTDVNIISGMEQTSFVFLQAAEVGLSHSAVLRHILESACHRANVSLPPMMIPSSSSASSSEKNGLTSPVARGRIRVYVLFGGGTSERQVSLISGTNVWLKLRARPEFEVLPLLLTPTPKGGALGGTAAGLFELNPVDP